MFENLKAHLLKRVDISDDEFALVTEKILVKQYKKREIVARAGEISGSQAGC